MAHDERSRGDHLKEHSDAELVRLSVAGNQDAMAVVFDRYYHMVMSASLKIVRDIAEAEDGARRKTIGKAPSYPVGASPSCRFFRNPLRDLLKSPDVMF